MALSEFELKKWEVTMTDYIEQKRPPAHIRDQLDISFRINGQNIEIFEIRPAFDDPQDKFEAPIAKATYVRSTEKYNIYWMKSDLKWHAYKPRPEVNTLEEFIHEIDADEYSCFWG